jgi:lipopolysaccharide transport system ATP-binding protein
MGVSDMAGSSGFNAKSREPGEVVVSATNVSKKFCRKLRRSMAYGIVDLGMNLLGMRPDLGRLRRDEFWALKDVSFELRRGEVLGLIGLNGSGKTTLLRLLAGILPPDTGEIRVKGRVGALIAVGAGFHPHMTGRENIYLNGIILGMSRYELDSKFRDIVEFSEIGDFLDAPVSTYSAGMRVRLGYSIAVHIEPDILIIDEVLAVGDIAFKMKCFNMLDRITRDAAVIIVSSEMPPIARICTDVMVLNNGVVAFKGDDVTAAIEYYYSSYEGEGPRVSGSGRAEIDAINLYVENSTERPTGPLSVKYMGDLCMEIFFSTLPGIDNPRLVVCIYDKELRPVAELNSYGSVDTAVEDGGAGVSLKIPKLQLSTGQYSVSVIVLDEGGQEILCRYDSAKTFRVVGSSVGWAPFRLECEWRRLDAGKPA